MTAQEVRTDKESGAAIKYKLKGNGSFAIREGWLSKGLRSVINDPNVFLREDATEILGVGSAMVKSMRFWMLAAGLTTEPKAGKKPQSLTATGEYARDYDPYFEDLFTLWLIHYHLVSGIEMTTVWYLLFNRFTETAFTRDGMTEALLARFRAMDPPTFAESSFRDDCMTLLRTYASEGDRSSPEDNMQSPLVALGLLEKTARGKYAFAVPDENSLPDMAVLYVLLDRMGERSEISASTLLTEECNVGKVFRLPPYRLGKILDRLAESGLIELRRTAGLNIVRPRAGLTADAVAKQYYRERRHREWA